MAKGALSQYKQTEETTAEELSPNTKELFHKNLKNISFKERLFEEYV